MSRIFPALLHGLFAALLLSGCGHVKKALEAREAAKTDASIKAVPDEKGRAYFPDADYHTHYLRDMGEPSLAGPLPPGTTFVLRYIQVPAFQKPDNVMVRVYDRDGVVKARAVRQWKNGDSPRRTKTAEDRRLILGRELPEPIRRLARSGGFWKPINDPEQYVVGSGLDGSTWILEWRDATGHYVLNLWSPDYGRPSDKELRKHGLNPAEIRDFSPYVRLGNLLQMMAGMEYEEEAAAE